MSKKEIVKITPEGLNLLMVLDHSRIDGLGFYGKEVFFSTGFPGNDLLLHQALGNIGAYARKDELDDNVSYIIVSNKLIKRFRESGEHPFIRELEDKLNQDNSPYRKIIIIGEDQLVWHLENRSKVKNDEQLAELVSKYKASKKKVQQSLF
jgi:hypothetical protein